LHTTFFYSLEFIFTLATTRHIVNHSNKEVNMATNKQAQHHTPINNIHNRGFASMPHHKVEEIARKGGHASAVKAGHEGMAARGRSGGHASAKKAGHDGMAARGRAGGKASAEKAGPEGMAARGRMGGHALAGSRHRHK
jgi:hypothetical protein